MILVAGEEVKVLLPSDADAETDITKEIRVEKESFPAPIVKGRVYGEMDILFRGEKVATVPGISFGADDCVRLSYALSEDDIEEGLKRIARFVKALALEI